MAIAAAYAAKSEGAVPLAASGRDRAGLYALLPALALTAGIAVSLLSKSWDRMILPLEVFADLFIVLLSFRLRGAGARWWRAAAAALLAGDSVYLAGHTFSGLPAWVFMFQETFYTASRFLTGAYLFANLPAAGELEPAEKAALAALAAASAVISVHFLIIPYFNSGHHPALFFRVNSVLNRLAECAVFPLALLLGMKARSRYWLYMTHGITLISISSIAIGYFIAISTGGAAAAGVPVQEYGWLFGLLGILAAQAYQGGAGEPFARWDSARVRLVWLVLVFNLALMLSMYFIRTFISGDAFQLTSVLFVFFGLWLVANLIAFKISGDLDLLLDSLDSSSGPGPRPVFGVAIREARAFAERLVAAHETIRAQSRLAALASVSAQVAHDIRSPLAALGSALGDLSGLSPERRELARGAMGRINEIAGDLLERHRRPGAESGGLERHDLAVLAAPVLEEKRAQFSARPGLRIDFSPSAAAAAVQPAEFRRLLSNLVNNAAEAIEGAGTVRVSVYAAAGRAVLEVSDDGKGVPPELLAGLGRRGATHGKEGGSGLGLHHARACAEAWGGSLKIGSSAGRGTTVRVDLPAAAAAPLKAALLDDDQLVHMTWRAAARAAGAELLACKDPAEFLSAVEGRPRDLPLYIDSDLGGGRSGEEIAAELRGKGFTDITLATGHPPERFAALGWLKVAGKEPPWRPGDAA